MSDAAQHEKDEMIARLRFELAACRSIIESQRHEVAALQAAVSTAAHAPHAAAYRLVHVDAESVAHQTQVLRSGAIRRVVDKRRQLNLLVRLEDASGAPVDPTLIQPGGLHLRALRPPRSAPLRSAASTRPAPGPRRPLGAHRGHGRGTAASGERLSDLVALEGAGGPAAVPAQAHEHRRGRPRPVGARGHHEHGPLVRVAPAPARRGRAPHRRRAARPPRVSPLRHSSIQAKLALLSKEVDGRQLQIQIDPADPALRDRIHGCCTLALTCLSRQPDSRRPTDEGAATSSDSASFRSGGGDSGCDGASGACARARPPARVPRESPR